MGRPKRQTETKQTPITTKKTRGTKKISIPSKLSTIVEKGHVFFFYRPKVESEEEGEHKIHSLNDVSKFYMLLSPTDSTATPLANTLLVMTGKMMPRISSHDRRGAFVDMVSSNITDITNALGEREYDTRVTHRHRFSPAARPCGEGIYEIILHGSSLNHEGHTHFVYELEIPQELGVCQHAFHIAKTGSYEVTLKNPTLAPVDPDVRKGLSDRQKPHYTQEQMTHFRGRRVDMLRWAPLDPSFLHIVHSELLLVGLSNDLRSEEHVDYLHPPENLIDEIHEQEESEMKEAQEEFGRGHLYEKVYADLDTPEATHILGPHTSLQTGKFA